MHPRFFRATVLQAASLLLLLSSSDRRRSLLSMASVMTWALQPNSNGIVNMALVLQGGPDGTKEGTKNALALQGAKEACQANLPSNMGYQYKSCKLNVLTPSSETQGAYAGLIPSKAGENDFMMALGYYPSKAIQSAADANEGKLFAIADFEFLPPVGNIASVMYSEDQIGYLAGLLAGEVGKTRGGKVAVIGGVDQPSVRRQMNGFGNGVKISCPNCKAYGVYSGTFESDANLSSTVHQIFKDHEVSVVFNAASIFGTMTLKNMTTQEGTYGIGSGSDEWVTNWAYGSVPGSEHILTSIQTDYTVMVRSVMQSVLRANLTGGSTVFYGVNPDPAQSAIKLAPVHEAGGVVTKEMLVRMQGYVADMAKGQLKTGVDHKSGENRLGGSPTSVELLSLTSTSKPDNDNDSNSTSTDGSPTRKSSTSSSTTRELTGDLTIWARLLVVFVAVQVIVVTLIGDV